MLKARSELSGSPERTDKTSPGGKGRQAGKGGQEARDACRERKAQDLERKVVTIGSHNASPEAKKRNDEDHDWECLDGQISWLLKANGYRHGIKP